MEELSPDTDMERKARGRALLSRIQSAREKLEEMIPQKKSYKRLQPTTPNEASQTEWQMFHFASQLVNWFRVSAVFLGMAIVALLWGNMVISNRKPAYVASPPSIITAAEAELGNRINQSAKLDNLRLFLGTILPRLKEIHYEYKTDMTPLKGLVSPDILNSEMRYRRGIEQGVQLNQIVLTLTVNSHSINNYVYNQKENRFSIDVKGNYRVSARKTSGDAIRNEPFEARVIMEEVPLSAANPFGFFLLKLEERKDL